MTRMTRKHLEAKVEALNERLGTGYKLNYCSFYGGYAIEDRTSKDSNAPKNTHLYMHGFRLSGQEMAIYLDGALHTLQDLGIDKSKEKILKVE